LSEKKSFLDKVTHFIFGDPIPVLGEHDLQLVRDLSHKLDKLSEQLKTRPVSTDGQMQPVETLPGQGHLDDLAKQVEKLAKTQFKANTLQETQLAQYKEAIAHLEQALEQQENMVVELNQQRQPAVEAAQLELLKSMLPVLDSLDAAFDSGRRQVLRLPIDREVRQAVVAWLDGIRLARLRMLDLLAAHGVKPIPSVGQPFDPHYHIAVATDSSGRAPDGIIISQDRSGYATSSKVLREAEVVVSRSK
jgi:molecular chaperone GrpE